MNSHLFQKKKKINVKPHNTITDYLTHFSSTQYLCLSPYTTLDYSPGKSACVYHLQTGQLLLCKSSSLFFPILLD